MRSSFRREWSRPPASSPRVIRQFSRTLQRLEVLGFVLVAIGVCGMVWISSASSRIGSQDALIIHSLAGPAPPLYSNVSRTATSANLRLFYQYSVIPGGVQSADELREAVADDPVIASHYSDFGMKHVSFVTLGRDQAFYVSYRLPAGVFWTSRPMLLHRGEKLATDGFNLARIRCGNRLSEVPLLPVSPAQPTPEEMNVAGVVRAPQGVLQAAHIFHKSVPIIPIVPFFILPGGGTPPVFFSLAPLPVPNGFFVVFIFSVALLIRAKLRGRMQAERARTPRRSR